MIDAVINDMAYAGEGSQVEYSALIPFNKKEYFHPFCYISDYSNATNFQNCWLGDDTVSLPDLNTESDFVKQTWETWVSEMVSNYSRMYISMDLTYPWPLSKSWLWGKSGELRLIVRMG